MIMKRICNTNALPKQGANVRWQILILKVRYQEVLRVQKNPLTGNCVENTSTSSLATAGHRTEVHSGSETCHSSQSQARGTTNNSIAAANRSSDTIHGTRQTQARGGDDEVSCNEVMSSIMPENTQQNDILRNKLCREADDIIVAEVL